MFPRTGQRDEQHRRPDEIPLARFAHACVRTLICEPGWTPPQPERKLHDEVPGSDFRTANDSSLLAIAYLDLGGH